MRSVWSGQAFSDLVAIREYIRLDSPESAARVATAIMATVRRLEQFPGSGRAGRIPGTREAPVSGTPFIIVYRVDADAVGIVHVIHGARLWPPGEPDKQT